MTEPDRQDIADGLAEGLSYAEIAHRLGRPTSTITREVARNGGPHDYRPGRAQLAATRRARRRPVRRLATPPEFEDAPGRDPDEVLAYTAEFTETLVRTGFPRMMARVFACLCTTDSGSLTAADLATRLQVSPASISTAVRFLEEQQQIVRQRDGAGRRDRYAITADAGYRTIMASAQGTVLLAETMGRGARVLGPDTPAGRRLREGGEFMVWIHEHLMRAAQQWQRDHAESESTADSLSLAEAGVPGK